QTQAIGHRPLQLAECRRAGVAELQKLIEAVTVEQAWCRGGRSRGEEKTGCRRALLLLEGWVGIERLPEVEAARNDVQVGSQIAGIANFLRPLRLVGRRRRNRGDGNPDEVTVVRRLPIPVAPRG